MHKIQLEYINANYTDQQICQLAYQIELWCMDQKLTSEQAADATYILYNSLVERAIYEYHHHEGHHRRMVEDLQRKHHYGILLEGVIRSPRFNSDKTLQERLDGLPDNTFNMETCVQLVARAKRELGVENGEEQEHH